MARENACPWLGPIATYQNIPSDSIHDALSSKHTVSLIN